MIGRLLEDVVHVIHCYTMLLNSGDFRDFRRSMDVFGASLLWHVKHLTGPSWQLAAGSDAQHCPAVHPTTSTN